MAQIEYIKREDPEAFLRLLPLPHLKYFCGVMPTAGSLPEKGWLPHAFPLLPSSFLAWRAKASEKQTPPCRNAFWVRHLTAPLSSSAHFIRVNGSAPNYKAVQPVSSHVPFVHPPKPSVTKTPQVFFPNLF